MLKSFNDINLIKLKFIKSWYQKTAFRLYHGIELPVTRVGRFLNNYIVTGSYVGFRLFAILSFLG